MQAIWSKPQKSNSYKQKVMQAIITRNKHHSSKLPKTPLQFIISSLTTTFPQKKSQKLTEKKIWLYLSVIFIFIYFLIMDNPQHNNCAEEMKEIEKFHHLSPKQKAKYFQLEYENRWLYFEEYKVFEIWGKKVHAMIFGRTMNGENFYLNSILECCIEDEKWINNIILERTGAWPRKWWIWWHQCYEFLEITNCLYDEETKVFTITYTSDGGIWSYNKEFWHHNRIKNTGSLDLKWLKKKIINKSIINQFSITKKKDDTISTSKNNVIDTIEW